MTGRRSPSVHWPLMVSLWALIAAMLAFADGDWVIVICAAIAAVACWGSFAFERMAGAQ